jgi:hypothetical protein
LEQNKLVVRYRDGRTLRGQTADFVPARPSFHLVPTDPSGARSGAVVEVQLADLKALFFVKDLVGNPAHAEATEFAPGDTRPGRRIRVEFLDGEVLVGTTLGYQASRPGFFVIPADPRSNNQRCFVVSGAVKAVTLL